jgi:hypothetical protein
MMIIDDDDDDHDHVYLWSIVIDDLFFYDPLYL